MKKLLRYIGLGLKELFWISIAVGVVFGGINGFRYLGENREVVEPAIVERPLTLVETMPLLAIDTPLPIRGEGFMRPHRAAALASQVGGQIVELHPAITDLGTFLQGEVLARLDDSAEQAALRQANANVDSARARLNLNQNVLERTEALFESGNATQVALDQVRSAQDELVASLNSLTAAQNSAQLNLDRKSVIAPFNGAVSEKTAEIGTVVNAGQSIARIFTQDRMEIDVSVREAEAALIPGLFEGASANAIVSVRFAGQDFEWDAHVARVAPNLDSRTRTLSVTVELDDVNAARSAGSDILASGAPPALINSFAKVVIEGPQPALTFPIPSTALRGGGSLWLFVQDGNGRGSLEIAVADLIHVDGETSYVRTDQVPAGAQLITTALSTPQVGMQLQKAVNGNLSVFALNSSE